VFTKAVALRYAQEGIRVNSLHPGPIKTPANDFFSDQAWLDRVIASVPLGRVGEADEVAYGMLFLASDEASFVTGAELVIDGGWTAR
jgi:NAD(P)-dependent dehydrogenase (short-subunit alcohol dehydrogenase family)